MSASLEPRPALAAVPIALAGLWLLSCALGATEPLWFRHPETGVVMRCGPYPTVGLPAIVGAERERTCVESLERAGYLRIPAPEGD